MRARTEFFFLRIFVRIPVQFFAFYFALTNRFLLTYSRIVSYVLRTSTCLRALVRSFPEKRDCAASDVGGRAAPCYPWGRSRETRRPRTVVRRRRFGIWTPRDAGLTLRERGRGLRDPWCATPRCACLAAESRAHSRRTAGTGATNPATRRSRQASAKSELEMLVAIGADPDPLRDHSGRRRERFETSKIDPRIRGNLRLPPDALAPKIFSEAHVESRDSWPEKALYLC